MGACFYKHVLEDENHMKREYKLQQDMAVVRSRIQGKKLPVICMCGSHASGVDTHGASIAARFGYTHIGLAQRDAAGRRSDARILAHIRERMVAAGDTKGYLLTGFPRSARQVQLFYKEVGPVDCIIYLEGNAVTDAAEPAGEPVAPPPPLSDVLVETVDAREPAAGVFLKIEAIILDRLACAL